MRGDWGRENRRVLAEKRLGKVEAGEDGDGGGHNSKQMAMLAPGSLQNLFRADFHMYERKPNPTSCQNLRFNPFGTPQKARSFLPSTIRGCLSTGGYETTKRGPIPALLAPHPCVHTDARLSRKIEEGLNPHAGRGLQTGRQISPQ